MNIWDAVLSNYILFLVVYLLLLLAALLVLTRYFDKYQPFYQGLVFILVGLFCFLLAAGCTAGFYIVFKTSFIAHLFLDGDLLERLGQAL
ncbi:MAG: hypothetical protein KJ077_11325 [Anaerolineae bacterium]|nr:hypothetical protein [Anaerolineae bacterium]